MQCYVCDKEWETTGHWCLTEGAPESVATPPDVSRDDYDRLVRRVAYLEGALVNATTAFNSAVNELRLWRGKP